MRPNSEEVLRGVQASLLANVLPEVQTEYTRTQVMIIYALLGIVANGWDGAWERVLADNGRLRELAARAASALSREDVLAGELHSLASSGLPLGLKAAAELNVGLASSLARVAASDAPELASIRAEVIDWLRADAESRSYALMGPRADG